MSSAPPSDKSFSRGSLQEPSALIRPSLWSCSDVSVAPESGPDCPGLLSGFDLMDKLGEGGPSMLGRQHRPFDTGGVGVGVGGSKSVCPSRCSGARALGATGAGAVCKAL